MNITGQLSNLEIDAEGKVKNVEGQISEVALENGERITIIGEIKRIMRSSKTSTASAFRVETPGKPSEFISSADSPKLYNEDGSERELPRGATVKQEFQAKAGNREENEAEAASEPVVEESVEETPETASEAEASAETQES